MGNIKIVYKHIVITKEIWEMVPPKNYTTNAGIKFHMECDPNHHWDGHHITTEHIRQYFNKGFEIINYVCLNCGHRFFNGGEEALMATLHRMGGIEAVKEYLTCL